MATNLVRADLGCAFPGVSSDRLEVVLLEVVGDLLAEHRSLHIGGAEVDAGPHAGVDDFLEDVRETVEAPRGAGFVAERAEGDLVGAEEVLERVHERTSCAGVARGVVGEGRRDERRRVADRCRLGRTAAATSGRPRSPGCRRCRPRGSP